MQLIEAAQRLFQDRTGLGEMPGAEQVRAVSELRAGPPALRGGARRKLRDRCALALAIARGDGERDAPVENFAGDLGRRACAGERREPLEVFPLLLPAAEPSEALLARQQQFEDRRERGAQGEPARRMRDRVLVRIEVERASRREQVAGGRAIALARRLEVIRKFRREFEVPVGVELLDRMRDPQMPLGAQRSGMRS